MPEVAYLVQGAALKCTNGSANSLLNLPLSHGVYCDNQPVLTMQDALPMVNILPFSICAITKGPCVPSIIGQWIKPYTQTQINGIPVLTTDSFLVCSLGGLIKPNDSGQV